MGSRINIQLTELLNNPDISVALSTDEINDGEDNPGGRNTRIPIAEVSFGTRWCGVAKNLVYSFDYTAHNGQVELSADFNWFRYGASEDAPQKRLLRNLYEHGVTFRVTH